MFIFKIIIIYTLNYENIIFIKIVLHFKQQKKIIFVLLTWLYASYCSPSGKLKSIEKIKFDYFNLNYLQNKYFEIEYYN